MISLTGDTTTIDPVCGMSVDPATAFGPVHHAGQDYYFCAASCRDKFRADPERYLKRGAEPMDMPEAMPGAIYTCPMHPDVKSDQPGSCPICGMALEPVEPTGED